MVKKLNVKGKDRVLKETKMLSHVYGMSYSHSNSEKTVKQFLQSAGGNEYIPKLA